MSTSSTAPDGTAASGAGPHTTLFDFDAETLSGDERALSEYRGDVVLVVNTASKCGFTPQFEGLQKLYEGYRERGFVVLGFPSGQFRQEHEEAEKIGAACTRNYGVDFPMFAKTDVNGPHAHPVFAWLKEQEPGALGKLLGGRAGSGAIKWNFTKFLVGRDGEVIARFAPKTTPEQIAPEIERALGAPAK
ncbi:glutathione peroxidase [Dietzia sp.]|uniref:glutathione peroxidase n=1 Tax=Dietzia sp. TaxID=1871616 RepID=UPI002FDA11F6